MCAAFKSFIKDRISPLVLTISVPSLCDAPLPLGERDVLEIYQLELGITHQMFSAFLLVLVFCNYVYILHKKIFINKRVTVIIIFRHNFLNQTF